MASARILIVDDEPLIRWSLAERLHQDGYTVLEASTGREAMEHFRNGVDLVLLDYRLPDSDGLSVLRRLSSADPTVPVILLTASSGVDAAGEAIAAGAHSLASKPFCVERVARVVGCALNGKALRDPLDYVFPIM